MKPDTIINAEQAMINSQEASSFKLNASTDFLRTPEKGSEFSINKSEKPSEIGAISADVAITTMLPQPVIDEPIVDDKTTASSYPTVAADDDLIEKDWVDKAKKIISDTKDNPHQQEKEISELQVKYLKDRFKIEIGNSGN